ncbi:MAG: hypothetical protein RLP14_08060 [Owenweeksia sp.]
MIRRTNFLKSISLAFTGIFLFEILFPTAAWALTGGPSQPEVESFEPIGTNQMVDPFTGDFTYNIPLLDVGGYPVNISYHSGITMDQEASWVGLGWNINPGVINRNLRGLPDDFNGDEIYREFNMKKNQTFGITGIFGVEAYGVKIGDEIVKKDVNGKPSFGLGINYNSYTGIGMDIHAGVSVGLAKTGSGNGTANLGINMVSSSNNGLTVSPSLSFSSKVKKGKLKSLGYESLGGTIGVSFNSRAGLTSMSLGASGSRKNVSYEDNGKRVYSEDAYGMGSSSSISFVPSTYLPQQQFPFESGNYSASVKVGGTLFGLDGTFNVIGSYAYQKLKKREQQSEAYGYLYSENALNNNTALMDFNREKDRAFSRHTPNLPLTNLTYDLYGISGQGVNGMFRAHRSDVGYVRDPYVRNTSASFHIGAELGLGGIAKFGLDGTVNEVTSTTGMWDKQNNAKITSFLPNTVGSVYENSYFKRVGEPTADLNGLKKENWKSKVYNTEPVHIELDGSDYSVSTKKSYRTKSKSSSAFTQISRGEARDNRNQVVSTLTASEIESGLGTGSFVSPFAKNHHIAEITVLKMDGGRYVYGRPAYNTLQKDVTFNVSGNSARDCSTGLINYGGSDDSKDNKKGVDNFYEMTQTPPYAHSYLISAVLSSDYADLDRTKGPSIGDIGGYVKFGYSRAIPYNWRVPYLGNKAAYDQGLKTLGSDDKGNYLYGEKELVYLDTIQTRTHIALFHKSARADGYGVIGKDGGQGTVSMLKLDSISLYTFTDFMNNINTPEDLIPIKRVHFRYDYSLCPGVDNNSKEAVLDENEENINVGKGKLTLKELYFTYGKSRKAKFSPYRFTYADPDHDGSINASSNPSYNLKGYDRWGNYKPNDAAGCGVGDPISAPEFPYTEQNEVLADLYSSTWNMTSVEIPSGGKLLVDYESDDYAYVQDKPAMQMFQIAGAGNSTSFSPSSPDNVLYDGKTPREYLYFKLQDPISPGSGALDELKENYFKEILDGNMYFRCLVNLAKNPVSGNFEYVSGYLKVTDVGFASPTDGQGDYTHGFIKIKKVGLGDDEDENANAHPISVAGWNFARSFNPELAYKTGSKHMSANPGAVDNPGEDIFLELFDAFENFVDIFKGPNGALRSKDYSRTIKLGKSWLRLYNPSKKKYGGGVRVKQIRIRDEWDTMTTNGSTSEYGQEYTYELEDGSSSGVAAYEPLIGGDENPFRQSVSFSEPRLLVPDQKHYLETPFGESFFPSPTVGYSQVTVKNLQYQNVNQNATGKIVHEFYTAKDYPTRTDFTEMSVRHKPASFLSKMISFSVQEHMNTSQGYTIETNDMHGKPKAQWVYAEDQENYISGVEYKYKTASRPTALTTDPGSRRRPDRKTLGNEVPLYFDDNTIKTREIGVDYDMVNDFKYSQTRSSSGGLNFNLATILALLIPLPIPTLIPSKSSQVTQYRSAVTTKVVNRYAIQEATIAYDRNSVIRTENLLWDAETGEVILTKTENYYEDPVYNLKYPAHLFYEQMGGAYSNIGYEEVVEIGDLSILENHLPGQFSTYPDPHFTPGDEVAITVDVNGVEEVRKAWVSLNGEDLKYDLCLIDERGHPVIEPKAYQKDPLEKGSYKIKVIRSGYRNQLQTPMQSLVLKKDPRYSTGVDNEYELRLEDPNGTDDLYAGVLDANAVRFDEAGGGSGPNLPFAEDGKPYPYKTVCEPFDEPLTDPYDFREVIGDAIIDIFKSGELEHDQNKILSDYLLNSYNPTLHEDLLNKYWWFSSRWGGNTTPISSLRFRVWGDEEVVRYGIEPLPGATFFDGSASAYIGSAYSSGLDKRLFSFWSDELVGRPSHNVQITDIDLGSVDVELNPTSINLIPSQIGGKITFKFKDHDDPNNSLEQTGYTDKIFIENIVVGYCYNTEGCPDAQQTPPTQHPNSSGTVTGMTINPYLAGLRGIWRPVEQYKYLTDREYSASLDLREDAIYSDFAPFYSYDYNTSNMTWSWVDHDINWTLANSMTAYDKYGNETENKDALGRYSAAIFGFEGSLAKAVGQNVQYGEMAYDGFEESSQRIVECTYGYFDRLNLGDEPSINTDYTANVNDGHTGLNSIQLPATSGKLAYKVFFNFLDPINNTTPCDNGNRDKVPYVTDACDVMRTFGQFEGEPNQTQQKFLVSYWVKSATGNPLTETDYGTPVQLTVQGTTASSYKTSAIIDGWQKVQTEFTVVFSSSAGEQFVEFTNNDENKDFLIDDIRIYPDDSHMKSYCYHPTKLRLMAELDENNFATFYEYDEEGMLIRVKKETERGIMTIKEHHNHNPKIQ